MDLKHTTRTAALATLVFSSLIANAQGQHRDGQIIVRFRGGYHVAAQAAHSAVGATVDARIPSLDIETISVGNGQSLHSALAHYRSLPYVEYAELNTRVHAFDLPNDPSVGQQWALTNMRMSNAWLLSQGSSAIKVAIIDTGIDLDHPDLAAKLVPGVDLVQNDGNPDDDHGHGTHCAGIAAAITNNGVGVAGIGFNSSLMPIKVLASDGSGWASTVAQGITWAADNGAKVISLSLGGSSSSQAQQDAVNYAWNKGVIVVAAAGNSGVTNASYPAYYTNAIAVASSAQDDSRSSFSNYGPWVDVAAPGQSILSTLMGGSYGWMSGTSMATPQVAGLAALVWEKMGTATSVSMIRQRIEQNCDPTPGNYVAFGRVNAERSLSGVTPPPPPPPAANEFSPSSATITYGSMTSGSIALLSDSDDQRMRIDATGSSTRRWDTTFSFSASGLSLANGFDISAEARASSAKGITAYVYNFQRNRWQGLSSRTIGTSDAIATWTISASSAPAYRSTAGEIRVRLIRSDKVAFSVEFDKLVVKSR